MNTKYLYEQAKKLGKGQIVKFIKDMKKNKIPVECYECDNRYHAAVKEIVPGTVLDCTKVPCKVMKIEEYMITYTKEYLNAYSAS